MRLAVQGLYHCYPDGERGGGGGGGGGGSDRGDGRTFEGLKFVVPGKFEWKMTTVRVTMILP